MADALRLFRERGFDLLLADSEVAAARGDLKIARAFQNPLVGGGGGYTWDYNPGKCESGDCSRHPWNANLSDQGLLFDLLIGKRRLKVDVAQSALEAARLSRADANRVLTAMLKQQYVQTVLARSTLGFAKDARDSSAKTADLINVRFHAGDVSEADLARAETSRLEVEQQVDVATEALASAKASLAFLLGSRDAVPDYELVPDLPPTVQPAALAAANPASLLEEARQHRPDLAASRANMASAEAALTLAQRERIPDIAVTGGYTQEGHGSEAIQPPTATFGLSLPLPLFYQNGGEIEKAEAALHTQEILGRRLDAQVASDVASAWAAWQSASSRVSRMQSGLLERATRARDLVEYQYRRGAASLLEVLDAQRTFVSTNAEYYQSLGDYWDALYQLEEATGVELGS